MGVRARLRRLCLRRRARLRRLRRRYRRRQTAMPRSDGLWAWMRQHEPQARRRLIVAIVFLYISIAGIMPAAIFGDVWAGRACFGLFAASALATWRLQKGVRRRFGRYIQSQEYRMCTHCGYLLVGLPDAYQCPECNTGYDPKTLEAYWQERVKRLIG